VACLAIGLLVLRERGYDVSQDEVGLAVTGAVALFAYAVRKHMTGVFVSNGGFRITEFSETSTYGWSDVAGIEVRQSADDPLEWLEWQALWVVTAAGTAVETALIRGEFWAAQVPKTAPFRYRRFPRQGLYLPELVFDRVVRDLRTEYDRHSSAG
jgi:hypothetical protein